MSRAPSEVNVVVECHVPLEHFMQGTIPHHSLAITRSERAQIQDIHVCQLAVGISEAHRREILEVDWLIQDIPENGPATATAEAAAQPVPDLSRSADRTCPTKCHPPG
jgi:uncharacterized protein (DUF305 family)